MVKFKLFLSLLTALFISYSGLAQNQEIDSLQASLYGSLNDSLKVKTLNAISSNYLNTSPNDAILFANKAKSLANKINYMPGLAYAYKNAGIGYFNQGLYADAINQYKSALVIFELLKDKKGIANINSNMGNVYYIQGEDYKALALYIKSLKIAQELGDKLRIATATGNIGAVYMMKRATYYKALEYNLKALKIGASINDKNTIGTSSVNIGDIYLDQGKNEAALDYYEKSLKAFEGTENFSSSLLSIGKVYFKKRDYTSAIKFFQQAHDYATKIDAKLDVANSLIELGKAYEKSKDYKTSLAKYKEAEILTSKLGATEKIKYSYEGLANSYNSMADFKNAFKYQKLLTSISDTLYNIDAFKKLSNLQFNFDLEKKQSEINLLQKDKELSTKEIKSKQFIQFALLAFLAAVSVLLVFVYRFYIIKKKSNIELEQKNQKIESQKSEITKSIEYAKKIQNAMLPEEELIEEVLFNSFLVYQPKDIVSGDFYVCIKEADKIFLAVADCTGHGVPGALMSMIGGNIINKLISDKGLVDPSEILVQLNEELITSLKQNKNAGNDGMDIALCSIDFKKHELRFAGAYRPLYMVRGNELKEIKGSKFPIGGRQINNERLFKTNVVDLQVGDKFYLSTDGYADQFGGAKGKKLTTKKFKEYILSIKDKHIKQQGILFQNFFEKWMGNNEQLDDICMIGFEVIEV